MENDLTNFGQYINCYKQLKGYYLNNGLYKKCYDACETCDIQGDNITHNCLECNINFSFGINTNNHKNCYKNCNHYYYFDGENNYQCTLNLTCPNGYSKSNQNTKECIKDDYKLETSQILNEKYPQIKESISYILDKQETEIITMIIKKLYKAEDIKELIQNIKKYENEMKGMTKEQETEFYDDIIDNVEDILTSKDFNTSNLDNGQNRVIKTEKITITLTTSQNQKNDTNNNITSIDLGECETELRSHYNLTNNEILYIKKMDVIQEGMQIPKIEYSVYYKSQGNNLERLNLSICENTKLFLSVPVAISGNLDILNTSSDYYNDKCYKSTSDSGTDMSLKDRQKEFVEGNKTVCQEECDFSDYDKDNQKANCSCKVKEAAKIGRASCRERV